MKVWDRKKKEVNVKHALNIGRLSILALRAALQVTPSTMYAMVVDRNKLEDNKPGLPVLAVDNYGERSGFVNDLIDLATKEAIRVYDGEPSTVFKGRLAEPLDETVAPWMDVQSTARVGVIIVVAGYSPRFNRFACESIADILEAIERVTSREPEKALAA